MDEKKTTEITTTTILKAIAIILGVVFIYLIRNILLMLFVSVIIASAVDAPIDWLVRHKIRRGLAVAMVYVLGIAIFGGMLYFIIPQLASQMKLLASNMPEYLGELEGKLQWLGGKFGIVSMQDLFSSVGDRLGMAASDLFVATINFFGGVFSALIVLIISIYVAVKEQAVKKFFVSLSPAKYEAYIENLTDRILYKLGAWFRGQIILMAVIGVMTYIGLTLLKVKFALTLALIVGLLEIVPIIGPIIAAVPAILFALLQSPGLALLTAALYYVIQELEKYLIVPLVMKRAVGLNPISIMVAVLIGVELHGIIGAIIAIPVAAVISIIFRDIMSSRKAQA
ncbi:MAG: AI-2E family transporter [bacterium]